MRKIILMTSAAVIAPISAIAQTPTCTATPDCASLGYTESSCPNGGVKCPWGDAWACTTSESEICSKYGFKYTCTGTGYSSGVGEACEEKYTSCNCTSPYTWNGEACACPTAYQYTCSGTGYSGGSGTACGGKYASCECAGGYKWKNGQCKAEATWGRCSGYAAQCSLGDILFSDGTCNTNMVSGKNPIAVIVYKSDDGNCGQAMALYWIGDSLWSTESTDILTLPNYGSSSAASKDYDSCGNSKKIMAAGNKSKYSAVWAAYNYTTTGTKVGDWCLPAAGIFTSYYNNQSVINTGFSRAGGTKFTDHTYAWSSSEYNYNDAWFSGFYDSDGLSNSYSKNYSREVRPVLAF